MQIIPLVSSVVLFVLTIYMMTHKRYVKHPYSLIAVASGFESFFYFTEFKPNRICEYDLAYLWNYSLAVVRVWFGEEWSVLTSKERVFKAML